MIRLILLLILNSLWPAPLRWEIKNDAYGEHKKHPNYDWERRTVLCALTGVLASCALTWIEHHDWQWTLWNAVKYSLCSAAIFIAVFPYAINYIHLKNHVTRAKTTKGYLEYQFLTRKEIIHHVLTHLSDSAVPDKYEWYRRLGPIGRLIAYDLLLIASVWLWMVV